jgi:2-polyprenyl-6-methoxyphenol hydroxylase-like FAD-dependent oxidoreductase
VTAPAARVPGAGTRVAVVGAGIAGLALGIAVSRFTDADVVVFEKHPGVTAGVGFAVNLAPNGVRILSCLGLLNQVREQGCTVGSWLFRRSNGRPISSFDLTFENDYGFPMMTIRRDLLLDILFSAAAAAGVDVRFGTSVTRVEPTQAGARISYSAGATLEADVVALCDDARSQFRTRLFATRPGTLSGQGQSFGISDRVRPPSH